jgi:hypothetical protein
MERIVAVAKTKVVREVKLVCDSVVVADACNDAIRSSKAIIELLRRSSGVLVACADVHLITNFVIRMHAAGFVS